MISRTDPVAACRLLNSSAFAFVFLVAAIPVYSQTTTYTFSSIDYPGVAPGTSLIVSTSNNGKILGSTANFSFVATPVGDGTYSFAPLPPGPGGFSLNPTAINSSGTVTGVAAIGTSQFGFLLSGSTYTLFSHPSVTYTVPYTISDAGVVTGEATTLDKHGSVLSDIGFIYDPKHVCFNKDFTDITYLNSTAIRAHGINSSCQVVGNIRGTNFDGRGNASFFDPSPGQDTPTLFEPTNSNSNARGIDDAGNIAGFAGNPATNTFAIFVGTLPMNWQLYYDTSYPPPDQTIIEGQNNNGVLQGGVQDSDGNSIGTNFFATPTNSASTVAGTNVATYLGAIGTATINVTFGSVTGGGTTSVTPISATTLLPLPAGYELLGDNIAFNLATTATYSPTATIAFQLPAVNAATFAAMRVLQAQDNALMDVTAANPAIDTSTQTIYATASSLGSFYIAVLLPTNKTQCGSAGWKAYAIFASQNDCVSYVKANGG